MRMLIPLLGLLLCTTTGWAGERGPKNKGPKKTPPGWSKGQKKGWGKDNLPPGLSKKQTDSLREEARKKGIDDTDTDTIVDAIAKHVGKGNRAETILDEVTELLKQPDKGKAETLQGIRAWIHKKTEEVLTE